MITRLLTSGLLLMGLTMPLAPWAVLANDERPADVAQNLPALPKISNLSELLKDINFERLTPSKGKTAARHLKVALFERPGILDKEIQSSDSRSPKTHIGRIFLKVLTDALEQAETKGSLKADYELETFRVADMIQFKNAADKVINQHFDLVLCPFVFPTGGLGDGKGLINDLVDSVAGQKILWINAAGDYDRSTRIAPVQGEKWVTWQVSKEAPADGIIIECHANQNEQCPLELTLTWTEAAASNSDEINSHLDLYLLEGGPIGGPSSGAPGTASGNVKTGATVSKADPKTDVKTEPKIVASSDPNQSTVETGGAANSVLPVPAGVFGLPSKTIQKMVGSGRYLVKVKINGGTFQAATDQLRITAEGTGISMINPSEGESLLPPADNNVVFAIGATNNDSSSKSKLRTPEIQFTSLINFARDGQVAGTPYAAAKAAALAILQMNSESPNTESYESVKNILDKASAAGSGVQSKARPAAKAEVGQLAPPLVLMSQVLKLVATPAPSAPLKDRNQDYKPPENLIENGVPAVASKEAPAPPKIAETKPAAKSTSGIVVQESTTLPKGVEDKSAAKSGKTTNAGSSNTGSKESPATGKRSAPPKLPPAKPGNLPPAGAPTGSRAGSHRTGGQPPHRKGHVASRGGPPLKSGNCYRPQRPPVPNPGLNDLVKAGDGVGVYNTSHQFVILARYAFYLRLGRRPPFGQGQQLYLTPNGEIQPFPVYQASNKPPLGYYPIYLMDKVPICR
ncbi:MAG: hypothetical protein C5B49_14475 [Bdellovibrio sp.]|nr:MAG: hypothetical protein C5B49_14475 [Bdellovibrio sp.]